MVKILHVCSGKGLGGTRTVFLAHQRLFEELDLNSTPTIRKGALVENKLSVESSKKLEVLNYIRRIPIKLQKDYSKMKDLAKSHDLIWVHKPIDCHIWREISKTAKIVMVVHGFQNTNLEKADYLVAVSVPVFEHLQKKGLKNVFLVNNFLLNPISNHKIDWNDKIQISAFGFFRRKKGFTDLVDSIGFLENKLDCKNFNLDLYGNGRLSVVLKIKKYLQNIKTLTIHGWTQDMQQKLLKSDIVVIPSRSESFSMVTIEAMATGCLVISTKCGGPEFIINNGETGVLVDKNNPKKFAEMLFEVISNPDDFIEMRKSGRKMVSEKFTIESSKKSILEIIEKIV